MKAKHRTAGPSSEIKVKLNIINFNFGPSELSRLSLPKFVSSVMPSSHFYVQSYGLLRFGHTWGVVVNRGRNRRVYRVMRKLSWANVSERIGSGRLKKFLNMFKNKK